LWFSQIKAVKAYYRMGLAYLNRDQFELAKAGMGGNLQQLIPISKNPTTIQNVHNLNINCCLHGELTNLNTKVFRAPVAPHLHNLKSGR
jgi:hypothetical protein